jgi:hypothetical protein
MTAPVIVRQNGIVAIRSDVDAAFRKALLDGVPVSLRSKMVEALAATPGKEAAAHSKRYFGEELPAIVAETNQLLFFINKYLSEQLKLPGLYDWLNATNFGNDYRMIKVFKAWSEMRVSSMRWRVKYYYSASGMEGRADEKDFGIVEAPSADEARNKVVLQEYPVDIMYGANNQSSTREFFRGCLRVTPANG